MLKPLARSTPIISSAPEFDKPPVIEVAASIQFKSLEELDVGRLGLLWAEYRDRYPRVEHHTPIAAIVENFERPSPSGIRYSLESTIPVPRVWFLNQQGTRLLQIQQDRFVLNWRKLDTEEAYPHYPQLREDLEAEFQIFQQFLEREDLPSVKPNQAELTYVNHIAAQVDIEKRVPVTNVVALWDEPPQNELLPLPEAVNFESRYIMRTETGPQGRLFIKLETRHRAADMSPVYVLQLIGRGAPMGEGLQGAFQFLDEAHKWIVEGFVLVTTDEMQNAWGRTR